MPLTFGALWLRRGEIGLAGWLVGWLAGCVDVDVDRYRL